MLWHCYQQEVRRRSLPLKLGRLSALTSRQCGGGSVCRVCLFLSQTTVLEVWIIWWNILVKGPRGTWRRTQVSKVTAIPTKVPDMRAKPFMDPPGSPRHQLNNSVTPANDPRSRRSRAHEHNSVTIHLSHWVWDDLSFSSRYWNCGGCIH